MASKKGLDHLINGYPDKRGGVEGIDGLHSRREVPAHIFQSGFNRIGRIQGIGAGHLPDGHTGGGLAVEKDVNIIGVRSQFRSSHVPDAHDGAVRIDPEGNGGKLSRGFKQALDDNRGIQPLTFYRRSPTELAGGDFDIIRLEGTNNIIHRQLVINQPVGVQPDAHGILGPEHFHLAYPRHPGQDLLQIGLGIIPQVDAVHAAVFRYQADHHQVISGGLADRDTP